MTREVSPETVAAASGIASDESFGAVIPPLYTTSTFVFEGLEKPGKYDYSRSGNPTRSLLAATLARLEKGAGAVVVSSGMAAIDLVLSRFGPADLILAPHDCYAGTRRLLTARSDKSAFNVMFLDQSDEAALTDALSHKPALVLVETPSNPLMRITDIALIVARAKSVGAKVAVDNTFLSPVFQTPISLGADYVIHSTTKYLNGHSDLVGGVVIAADEADVEALRDWANITGVTGSAFDASQTLRGLRTLFPRMQAQQRTALSLASFLAGHPRIRAVYYPGLETHMGHEIARTQQTGFGAMLSFDLAGDIGDVRKFLEALELFTLAESLGGTESLIAHPATMTHVSMEPALRASVGITGTLLRISVGLEAEGDLHDDLAGALSLL
ncbi:MAG: cystathionine gamma-synthase [Parvibaculum sp.]|nr:cystathionine gamma-synthase [Parvibaculum sp.]